MIKYTFANTILKLKNKYNLVTRFKVGDIVTYNWLARTIIPRIVNGEDGVYEISNISGRQVFVKCISFNGNSDQLIDNCDAIWLTLIKRSVNVYSCSACNQCKNK